MDREEVLAFAKQHDYKDIEYLGTFKDMDVYLPSLSIVEEGRKPIVGLPPNITEFILVVPNNSIISFSKYSLKLVMDKEIYKHFFPEEYEKFFPEK